MNGHPTPLKSILKKEVAVSPVTTKLKVSFNIPSSDSTEESLDGRNGRDRRIRVRPSKVMRPTLPAPLWVPDELVSSCMSCTQNFTLLRRRHHCRSCGQIFCNQCSSHTLALKQFGYNKPVRVCDQCFALRMNHMHPSCYGAHTCNIPTSPDDDNERIWDLSSCNQSTSNITATLPGDSLTSNIPFETNSSSMNEPNVSDLFNDDKCFK